MPRGPTRPWRALKPPLLDEHIKAAQANGELLHDDISNAEEALEIKRALFRAASRAKCSVHAEIEEDTEHPGKYRVRFGIHDKADARAYVIARYGTDRSQWPYDPKKKNEVKAK